MNLNDKVSVKLTKYGKRVLDEYRTTLEKDSGLEFKHLQPKEGIYSSELWDIMHIFGKYMYLGANQLFVDNEIIIK